MKITGVRTYPYAFKLNRKLGDANSPSGRETYAAMAVFIDTDEGISGVSVGAPAAAPRIHWFVDNLLRGCDPRGVAGLWKKMIDYVFKGGNRGTETAVIAAIDLALWDLKARCRGEPLWRTLGGSSPRVRAYASGLDMPLSDEALSIFYERMAAKGISAGKLKVGLDMNMDLQRIGIMKEALGRTGKTVELMVDANEYWSPKQAIRKVAEMERTFDLTWVEEPARRWDYRGLKKVSDSIRAAVATGENLDDISDYTPLIANGGVDVLNLGARAAGITGALKVAALAYAFEVPVSVMNSPGNIMGHFAACLPNHIMIEVLDAGRDAFLHTEHHVEDGWVVMSEAPGLGISYDVEELEEAGGHFDPSDTGPLFSSRRRGAGLYQVGPGEAG